MADRPKGFDNGLTNYGDPAFARYLRRSFAQSMGYTRASLDNPVVGICYTESGFNNCHRHFPHLTPQAAGPGLYPPPSGIRITGPRRL